jgi:hypothetical protein
MTMGIKWKIWIKLKKAGRIEQLIRGRFLEDGIEGMGKEVSVEEIRKNSVFYEK